MIKIEIKNLKHTYLPPNSKKIKVLNNINLRVEKGDFFVILGESGCGKTTLLNIIAGLLRPTGGVILVDNKKVDKPHFSRSFIFQQPCLLPWLNVRENIIFGCKLRSDKKDLSKRVNKYIQLMDLEGFEKIYPSKLSLGMSQRVAFARSLVSLPDILLLDEPFASLDFINRSRLQAELIRNWLYEQQTVIFVTHDIDEAILLGQKIVMFSKRPSKIIYTFIVDEKYPRDLNKEKLFNLKLKIQKHFKNLNNIKK